MAFKFDFKGNVTLYQLIAGLTAVTLILLGCIIVLKPFFPAALLATIFALSTWPAFTWLHRKLKGRTTLAATLMTLLLGFCFVVPVIIIGTSVADNYSNIHNTVQASLKGDPAAMGNKLQSMPYIGDWLEKYWLMFVANREKISAQLQEYSGEATAMLLKFGTSVGHGLFDVTLGVIIAFFLFRHGSVTAERVGALIEKFGGEHGQNLLHVCKNTLIGVVYGLLGTALAQGAFGALGFWIANVPGATFLGLLTFFLSLVPMGPPLVWIPVALWLFAEEQTGWAVFIIAWGAFVIGLLDNVMKPYFISRGSNLPLLLVLLGIMGGVLAFGFIGLFIGPTLLALAYSLVMEWSTVRQVAVKAMPDRSEPKPVN
jgi:predicted PurR-regulated permease PerM